MRISLCLFWEHCVPAEYCSRSFWNRITTKFRSDFLIFHDILCYPLLGWYVWLLDCITTSLLPSTEYKLIHGCPVIQSADEIKLTKISCPFISSVGSLIIVGSLRFVYLLIGSLIHEYHYGNFLEPMRRPVGESE